MANAAALSRTFRCSLFNPKSMSPPSRIQRAMPSLRRIRTLRRLLDEHIHDVFEPPCPLVDQTLAPRAVAPLQGLIHERCDLFPVAVLLERGAHEGEEGLDHIPRRDGSPDLEVHELRDRKSVV